jgi:mannosyl-oligosaccharide alpha-1,2-mannosidase
MAKRIVRWAVALFTAFVITLSLYNGSLVRDKLIASTRINPMVLTNSKWAKLPIEFPVSSYTAMPTGKPKPIPKIQYDFEKETEEAKRIRIDRLDTIKESFEHAWRGYREHAWLNDEVKPLSGGSRNVFGGWAATLVDSLDSLWILGMKKEFDEAVDAIHAIDFSSSTEDTLNIFETTIRYMGGFLAAYDLSGRKELLEKAVELGEMIYVAFDTPNRLPDMRWRWKNKLEGESLSGSPGTLSAEIGSLTLELTRLTQLTGDPKYFDAIQRVMNVFEEQQDKTMIPGMWPLSVDTMIPDFTQDPLYSLGAMADSLYEYLPKQYMLMGGHAEQYKRMYAKVIEVAKKDFFFRPMIPTNEDVLMSGNVLTTSVDGKTSLELVPTGQHLVCFVAGMVGIAAKIFGRNELDVARKLVDGCTWAYEATPTGIMPEVFTVYPCKDASNCAWDEKEWKMAVKNHTFTQDIDHYIASHNLPKGMIHITDKTYMLRPEAIESVFIMYRITGDPSLMEKGWKMFEAIEKATRTKFAHAMLLSVLDTEYEKADKMESFWTAETLKYFYLLFSTPDVMSLDEWVFNTEAHGFKRPMASDTPWRSNR